MKAMMMVVCALASAGALAQRSAQTAVAGEAEVAPLRAADSGALLGPDEAPLRIEIPAHTLFELGAEIDPAPLGGPTVVAVTPGGAAERIGLQVGDRPLGVNGNSLAQRQQTLDAMHDALTRGQWMLELDVGRADQRLALRGPAGALSVPAYALTVSSGASIGNCGHISIIFAASRSDDLYPVTIIFIDGKTPLVNAPSWRVKSSDYTHLS